MSNAIVVTDADFEANVEKAEGLTVVDFWATWCGPCRMVAPVVEELSSDYDGRVKFVKLNTDENPAVSGKYGIRSIPTLLIFKGGKVQEQIVGYVPKETIQKALDKQIS